MISSDFKYRFYWSFPNDFIHLNEWEQWLTDNLGPQGVAWCWTLFDRKLSFMEEQDLLAFRIKFGV